MMFRTHPTTPGRILALALCLLAATPIAASAHTGPPYPIFMDKPVGDQVVSVWADPDIGEASFFVVFDHPTDEAAQAKIEVWVRPTSERLERQTYAARRDNNVRNQLQFVAHPQFDAMEMWRIGVVIHPAGNADPVEWITEVQATPDGLSPAAVVVYALPFVFIVLFWIAALRRKWRMTNQISTPECQMTKLL